MSASTRWQKSARRREIAAVVAEIRRRREAFGNAKSRRQIVREMRSDSVCAARMKMLKAAIWERCAKGRRMAYAKSWIYKNEMACIASRNVVTFSAK